MTREPIALWVPRGIDGSLDYTKIEDLCVGILCHIILSEANTFRTEGTETDRKTVRLARSLRKSRVRSIFGTKTDLVWNRLGDLNFATRGFETNRFDTRIFYRIEFDLARPKLVRLELTSPDAVGLCKRALNSTLTKPLDRLDGIRFDLDHAEHICRFELGLGKADTHWHLEHLKSIDTLLAQGLLLGHSSMRVGRYYHPICSIKKELRQSLVDSISKEPMTALDLHACHPMIAMGLARYSLESKGLKHPVFWVPHTFADEFRTLMESDSDALTEPQKKLRATHPRVLFGGEQWKDRLLAELTELEDSLAHGRYYADLCKKFHLTVKDVKINSLRLLHGQYYAFHSKVETDPADRYYEGFEAKWSQHYPNLRFLWICLQKAFAKAYRPKINREGLFSEAEVKDGKSVGFSRYLFEVETWIVERIRQIAKFQGGGKRSDSPHSCRQIFASLGESPFPKAMPFCTVYDCIMVRQSQSLKLVRLAQHFLVNNGFRALLKIEGPELSIRSIKLANYEKAHKPLPITRRDVPKWTTKEVTKNGPIFRFKLGSFQCVSQPSQFRRMDDFADFAFNQYKTHNCS